MSKAISCPECGNPSWLLTRTYSALETAVFDTRRLVKETLDYDEEDIVVQELRCSECGRAVSEDDDPNTYDAVVDVLDHNVWADDKVIKST